MNDKNERENLYTQEQGEIKYSYDMTDDYIQTASDDELGLNIFKETKKANTSNVSVNKSLKQNGSVASHNLMQKKKNNQAVLSREQLQKRSKNRMIVVSVIIFVLCLSVGLGVFFSILSNKNNSLSVSFRYSDENKELGEVEYTIKNARNYAYGVYYPYFGNTVLDNKISAQSSSIISMFLSKYRHYSPSKKGTGAVLFSDYSSTDYKDYILIVRTSEYRIPDEETTYHICTIFYDTKNKKILSGGDVFDSTFKDIISVKIKKYLKENTSLTDKQIDSISNPRNLNTDNFSFDKNNFYFYINDTDGNTLTIKFDSSIIKSHMKMDFDTVLNNEDEEHSQVTD